MADDKELTYYEYWLAKKFWNARWAVQLVADYLKFKRPWEESDDYPEFIKGVQTKLKKQLAEDRAWHVFARRIWKHEGVDEDTDEWKDGEVNLEESEIRPKEFIQWLYERGYQIPFEFQQHIGVQEKESLPNLKQRERIDKEVCQAVGKTLWDEHPDMTIDQMQFHKAIQIYGSGRLYSTDTTLRKWLREVDRREVKTGPKKKIS